MGIVGAGFNFGMMDGGIVEVDFGVVAGIEGVRGVGLNFLVISLIFMIETPPLELKNGVFSSST